MNARHNPVIKTTEDGQENYIPAPSRKRLVRLAMLLGQQKKQKMTSSEMAALTGWNRTVIRRDIYFLGIHNGVSNGYDVAVLRAEICRTFGIAEQGVHAFCVVGLGNLGTALLDDFSISGGVFFLAAGFDSNMNRTEILKSSVPLFPTLDLEEKIKSLNIEYAVLSVPDEKAQFITDRLVRCGIKGIVNYTNTFLSVPRGVGVENAGTITVLTKMIAT